MTTVSAADASSVSAASAWCCSCCWHEQQVSSKKGIPNFGDLELGSQNIYDTRLNGENLFSDFRWCAPWRAASGYAWCCRCCHCCTVLFGSQFTGCRHAPPSKQRAFPAWKNASTNSMRFHAYAAGMHTLLTPPHQPKLTLATFVFEEVPGLRPTDGCGVITCTWSEEHCMAQVRS